MRLVVELGLDLLADRDVEHVRDERVGVAVAVVDHGLAPQGPAGRAVGAREHDLVAALAQERGEVGERPAGQVLALVPGHGEERGVHALDVAVEGREHHAGRRVVERGAELGAGLQRVGAAASSLSRQVTVLAMPRARMKPPCTPAQSRGLPPWS